MRSEQIIRRHAFETIWDTGRRQSPGQALRRPRGWPGKRAQILEMAERWRPVVRGGWLRGLASCRQSGSELAESAEKVDRSGGTRPSRPGRSGPRPRRRSLRDLRRPRPTGRRGSPRESRRHRKHPPVAPATGSTWRAPGPGLVDRHPVRRGIAAVRARRRPGYASAVGTRWDAVTFFTGSLFFTAAGFLTYREAVDAGPQAPTVARRRFFVFQPRRIDWWATAVQLAGTLFFNVSTGNAVRVDLTAKAANQHVWRPDAVGSVCFLVASALAWLEVCHGWTAWRPRSWSWWITLVNLIGSVAFGVSAVAGYMSPATGSRASRAVKVGTLIARCVLRRGTPAPAERTQEISEPVTMSGTSGA